MNEVVLATIENRVSTIECVHVGGVFDLENTTIGPTGTLVLQDAATLYTNFLDIGSGTEAHGTVVARGVGTQILENELNNTSCAFGRPYSVTVIGKHSSGSMLIADGAELDNTFVTIGRDPGASGYLKVDSGTGCDPMVEPRMAQCSQLSMRGVATGGSAGDEGFGAFGQIGRGGMGHAIFNRARALISLAGDTVTDPAKAGHGMNIARNAGSVGSLRLRNGSKFLIETAGAPNDLGILQVGRLGNGLLEVSGGSLVEIQGPDSFLTVARSPGSVGNVHLADGTIEIDGTVALSRNASGVDGGISLLTIDADSTVSATELDARPNSTIFSNGIINATNGVTINGVYNVGFSPGESVINADTTLGPTSLLRLEIVGPGGSGGADKFIVNGDLVCDDALFEISVSGGATIDDLGIVPLFQVSGARSGTADVVVVTPDGDVLATFDDADVCGRSLIVRHVGIDIKPGSPENTVNLGSNGVLSVAILSTPTFDATQIDPQTVKLSSAEIRIRGNGTFVTDIRDVDGDGLADLVIQVSTDALALSETAESALLTGATFAGEPFQGSDLVRIVPEGG